MSVKKKAKRRKRKGNYRVYYQLPAHAYITVRATSEADAKRAANRMIEQARESYSESPLVDWQIDWEDEEKLVFVMGPRL